MPFVTEIKFRQICFLQYCMLTTINYIHIFHIQMGNSNKGVKESTFKSSNPHLNKAKLIENSTHDRYIEAVFKAQNKDYSDWHNALKNSGCQESNYLLLPTKVNYNADAGLCGNTGTLTNQYPFFPHVLADLIKERLSEKKNFKESELWFALYSLTAALVDIRRNGKTPKLGDINPQNVFVNDEGHIRVANIYSWPHERFSYWKVLENDKHENTLLAPEDMNNWQTNHLDNDNNHQSELFAIGATIISAALLSDFKSVYDFKQKAISTVHLREKKMAFGDSKYSDIFKAIILNLVSVSPSDRLTLEELWNFIQPFHEPILRKEQFMIPSAPQKIEMSLASYKNRMY